MRLTVGITNYNYGKFLSRAINSAVSQGAEVIIVDEGSTDDTAQVLSMYEDNPNIIIVRLDSPTGNCAAGCNEIIKHASGEYIMFLDADDYLPPGSVSTFLSCAMGDDIIYSDINLVDDDGDYIGMWSYAKFPRMYRDIVAFARERKSLPVPMKGIFRKDFLVEHDLKYLSWETTRHAPDFRTCMEWIQYDPFIAYIQAPLYNYRRHEDPLVGIERENMERELDKLMGECFDD